MLSLFSIDSKQIVKAFDQIEKIKQPLARDALFIAGHTALMGVSATYHFASCSLKSLPLVLRLALSSVPLDIAKRCSEYFGATTVVDLQDHAEHGYKAIKLGMGSFTSPLPHSKQLSEALKQVKCFTIEPTLVQKIVGYSDKPVGSKPKSVSGVVTARRLAVGVGLVGLGALALGIASQTKARNAQPYITIPDPDLPFPLSTYYFFITAVILAPRYIRQCVRRVQLQFQPSIENIQSVVFTDRQQVVFDGVCEKLGLTCPISRAAFKKPVISSSGHSCDEEFLAEWLKTSNGQCPVTNKTIVTIGNMNLVPNLLLWKILGEIELKVLGLNYCKDDKDAIDKVISEITEMIIEDPYVVMKNFGDDYLIGMTIDGAKAKELIDQGADEAIFVKNWTLTSYQGTLAECKKSLKAKSELTEHELAHEPANNNNSNSIEPKPKPLTRKEVLEKMEELKKQQREKLLAKEQREKLLTEEQRAKVLEAAINREKAAKGFI